VVDHQNSQAEGEAPFSERIASDRGFIWSLKMNVPGLGPVALPIPIVHSDHRPPPALEEFFEVKPASEWNEHWAAIDLPRAQKVAASFLESFDLLYNSPELGW